ncbi:hypothetical protein EIB18_14595 [Caulobacter vibrioides]|nr:hypothetical protein EIB18_14595 [Caulobacter vibrioides]PLR07706.1 hypothetical protein CVUC_19345 [Caulobacter vibrioides]
MERETWDVGDSVAGWSRNSERPLRHAAAPRATSPVSRGRRMTLRPPAPLAGEVDRREATRRRGRSPYPFTTAS